MLNAITHSFVFVLDQDEALDFYVGKLGMEVKVDADLGNMRYLTVNVPGDADRELVLAVPGPPVMDEKTAEQARDLLTKGGSAGGFFISTDDCQKAYAELVARGVEFTQEPIERFYGTDCSLRDPFGNPIRIMQPASEPFDVPSPEEIQAGAG